jgi:hypothetical protein
MKLPYLSTLFLAAFAANAGAAVYVSDFNNLTTGPSEQIAGQDGWSITDPKPFLSYSIEWDNGTGSGPIPNNATIGLNHAYGEELGRTTATFDFSFIDSNAASNSLRDSFSFSLYNGATTLFSIIFTPKEVNPTVAPVGVWTTSFTSNNGAEFGDLALELEEAGTYSFYLDFKKNGSFTNVAFSVGNPGSPLERFRTVSLNSADTVTSFGFNWLTTEAGGGDNYMIFDNLSVVPEPSSALLVGLAGLAFVSSRRRLA